MATANLYTELTWDWQDWRGRDHEADLNIKYTCDADGAVVLTDVQGELPDEEFWTLADYITDYIEANVAPEAYSEWLADRAEELA
jgi:hypothetical protein